MCALFLARMRDVRFGTLYDLRPEVSRSTVPRRGFLQ